MKKLLLPLLLLVLFSMLAAVESDPSAVVGYFKKTVTDGAFQAIALPFSYGTLAVGSVLGDQFTDGDVILDINTGASSSYYTGFGWDGDLIDLAYGGAYFVNRGFGNGDVDYFLLGTVNPQGFSVTFNGDGAYTAFGINDASAVPLSVMDHPFGTDPVDGDAILEIDTGFAATYYDGYGWDGDLTTLNPGFGYYYNAAVGSTGYTWTVAGRSSSTQPLTTSKKK